MAFPRDPSPATQMVGAEFAQAVRGDQRFAVSGWHSTPYFNASDAVARTVQMPQMNISWGDWLCEIAAADVNGAVVEATFYRHQRAVLRIELPAGAPRLATWEILDPEEWDEWTGLANDQGFRDLMRRINVLSHGSWLASLDHGLSFISQAEREQLKDLFR